MVTEKAQQRVDNAAVSSEVKRQRVITDPAVALQEVEELATDDEIISRSWMKVDCIHLQTCILIFVNLLS